MLMGRVARMYYELGMTHQEIATELGVSRVRVTRLLAAAREQGIVEITVHSDEPLFASEERALERAYGLHRAWIAPSVGTQDKLERGFGVVGAEALAELTVPARTVAVGVSSAVALAVRAFVGHARAETEFVPVDGSSGGISRESNPHELALRLAAQTGGRAFHVPAPLLAATQEAARILAEDPSVDSVLQRARGAELLVAGIGGMSAGGGLLLPALSASEREELEDAGAVGDLSARFFDAAGRPIRSAVDQRVVGLGFEALVEIPERLVMARGRDKVAPLRAALEAGLVTSLVTDMETAKALASLASAPAAGS